MLKSGYDEELIDDRFITHAIKTKRKDLLQNRKRKKQRKVEKYRMVTNYEPSLIFNLVKLASLQEADVIQVTQFMQQSVQNIS